MRKSILLITLFAVMALVALLCAFQYPNNGDNPLSIKHFTFRNTDPAQPAETIPVSVRADSNVEFRWELGNPYLLKNGDGNVFLDLQVTGKNLPNVQRKRMNLVLVIDRSGSMGSEHKLDQVKEAANAIINNMNPTDRLAVVIYDDSIQTLIPSTPVENKEAMQSAIYGLTPGGSTNLYGGLQQGFEEARENFKKDYVNRIILLSDGLANVGITDPAQIDAEAKSIRENRISVSSMGVGTDYNESLMANIADYSGGNYYYISSDQNMAKIFRKEWNLMQKLVANNARATFELAKGVDVVDVAGFKWQTNGRKLTIEVPDIYSGETKRILVQLHTPADAKSVVDLGHGNFSCTEIRGDTTRLFAQAFQASIKVVEDAALVQNNSNRVVQAKVASVQASRQMEKAYDEYEAGNNSHAFGLATKAIESLRALGYTGSSPQVMRYEKFQQAAEAQPSAVPEESKKDILKKQKEADRKAQQSNPQ